MKAAFRRSRVKSGEVSAQAEEALSGIRLVKAFANEDLELQRFMAKSNELLAVRKESFGILSYFSGSVNFFHQWYEFSSTSSWWYDGCMA